MIKIAIVGAAGRMGRHLVEVCSENSRTRLTAATEHESHASIGMDVGAICGLPELDVLLSPDLKTANDFDVLIDFTRPESTMAHLDWCLMHGKKMVIGTTGLSPEQFQKIEQASEHIAIMQSPNMSIGVNVSLKLLQLAAKGMGDDVDIEIIEAHHRYKVDAPSGTALKMGEVVADTLGRDLKQCAVYGREGITGERDRKTIGFETIRAGDIVGDHTVMFADIGECLEIRHKASSRSTFAKGALRAATWLQEKPKGLFDMADVLGFKDLA